MSNTQIHSGIRSTSWILWLRCACRGVGMLVVSQQHVKSRMYTYFPSVIPVFRRIFYKNSRLFARLLWRSDGDCTPTQTDHGIQSQNLRTELSRMDHRHRVWFRWILINYVISGNKCVSRSWVTHGVEIKTQIIVESRHNIDKCETSNGTPKINNNYLQRANRFRCCFRFFFLLFHERFIASVERPQSNTATTIVFNKN